MASVFCIQQPDKSYGEMECEAQLSMAALPPSWGQLPSLCSPLGVHFLASLPLPALLSTGNPMQVGLAELSPDRNK